MANVVIVHGAGSGGWLWKDVRQMLVESGHNVYTPTLTGVGERTHLAGKTGLTIDLELHIQDICMVLEYEDLHDVTLLGHSYGGPVVVGVADRMAERIAQVIYLDAFVPEDNQSMLDLVPPQARAGFEQMVQKGPDGRAMAPPLPYPNLGRIEDGGSSEAEVRQLLERRVPQDFATYTQPVRLTNPAANRLPHTYILCTDKGPGDPFVYFAQRARDKGWQSYELNAGHFPMLTIPRELVALVSSLI